MFPNKTTVLTADLELYGGEGAITLVSNFPVRGVADHSNICYVRASNAREANKTCHTSSTFCWHFLEQSAVLLQPLPLPLSRARICTDALISCLTISPIKVSLDRESWDQKKRVSRGASLSCRPSGSLLNRMPWKGSHRSRKLGMINVKELLLIGVGNKP